MPCLSIDTSGSSPSREPQTGRVCCGAVAGTDLSQIISAAAAGDSEAAGKLLPLVYQELRKLAVARMANESPGQTLQPTALVHEAYLRLVDVPDAQKWEGRGHFFAAAAEAMRRILVERARRKATVKHGGGLQRIDLERLTVTGSHERADELLALDEAVAELERHDPRSAELVKLRYFAGLSHQEAAEALGIGRRAADRHWALAKAWLFQRMSRE
jgi:RNA polymerase sigma factor (TIGR02999 family)